MAQHGLNDKRVAAILAMPVSAVTAARKAAAAKRAGVAGTVLETVAGAS
jgi:hypothetical protein